MAGKKAAKKVLAVDLGASTGRVMVASYDGEHLHLDEVHRFQNIPIQAGDRLYWDFLGIWNNVQIGIDGVKDAASIGVDAWGVDYALLDKQGRLLSNIVNYRDPRTDGIFDWAFERIDRREMFERTGIQFMPINTVFQLASMVRDDDPILSHAAHIVSNADLLNYWMTGEIGYEFTHATTSQMFNPNTGDWDRTIMEALGIPTNILPSIVAPGSHIGTFNGIPVIAPPTHDTGSAVVAVPTNTRNYAYISSGTWSLLGLELDKPVINDRAYAANITNEGGYGSTYRFLKNIMGMWLVQQCRETWKQQGRVYSYDELVKMASARANAGEHFVSFVDPDAPEFLHVGDMPSRVREFCKRTGQPVPQTDAEIITTVFASLAMKYRYVLDLIVEVANAEVDRIHVIGGGAQNWLLNQMTADATGRPVVTGPVEATALGNAAVQLIALGEIGNLAEAREIISNSMESDTYQPNDKARWDEHFPRFKQIVIE